MGRIAEQADTRGTDTVSMRRASISRSCKKRNKAAAVTVAVPPPGLRQDFRGFVLSPDCWCAPTKVRCTLLGSIDCSAKAVSKPQKQPRMGQGSENSPSVQRGHVVRNKCPGALPTHTDRGMVPSAWCWWKLQSCPNAVTHTNHQSNQKSPQLLLEQMPTTLQHQINNQPHRNKTLH